MELDGSRRDDPWSAVCGASPGFSLAPAEAEALGHRERAARRALDPARGRRDDRGEAGATPGVSRESVQALLLHG
jgi:hypothetical protein